MESLRKIGLWLSALLIGPLLLITTLAYSINKTVGNPDYIKTTANDSSLYSALENYISKDLVQKRSKEEQKAIKSLVATTITKDNLKITIEGTIDEIFSLLNKATKPADLSIDISNLTKSLKSNATKLISEQVSELPTCSGSSNPTSSDSVFEYECLPAGTSESSVTKKAVDVLLESNDMLKEGKITIGDISSGKNDVTKQNIQKMVDSYQRSKLILPISASLALLSALGVVFLTKLYSKGVRRLGTIFIIDGLLIGVVAFIIRALAGKFPAVSSSEVTINTAIEGVAKQTVIDMTNTTLLCASVVLVAGIIMLVISSIWIAKKHPETDKKEDKKDTTDKPASKETPIGPKEV